MKSSLKIGVFILLLALTTVIPVSAALTVAESEGYVNELAAGMSETSQLTLSASKSDPGNNYELTVLGLGNNIDGGYVGLTPEADTDSQSGRIYTYLETTEIYIGSGETVKVNVTITTPPGGGVGGYYSAINIRTKGNNISVNDTIITNGINVPIMVTLNNVPFVETGEIIEMNVTPIDINSTELPYVTSTFKNNGVHHYFGVKNIIEVSNDYGGKISFETTPLSTAIVPGGTVNFTQKINVNFTPGRYSAKSSVVTSNGNILSTNSTSFEYGDVNDARYAVDPAIVDKMTIALPTKTLTPDTITTTTKPTPGFGAILATFGLIVVAIMIAYRKQN